MTAYHTPPELPEVVVSVACATAEKSPCVKSKRGVVIWGRSVGSVPENTHPVIYGAAYNTQPWPYECTGTDACKKACGRLCVHAEQAAIMQMFMRMKREKPLGLAPTLNLLHVKVVDGELVPSPDGPSCDQCSKLIVYSGWIDRVWLYVGEGAWSSWSDVDFHRRTLLNLGLPVTL